MDPTTKRVAFLLLLFAVVFGLSVVLFPVEKSWNNKAPLSDTEKFLLEATNKLNSRLPMTIDSDTRLDNTMGVGNEMRFNFTLVNYTAEEVTNDEFIDFINTQMRNNICSTNKMDIYFERGVKVTYAYFGKEGKMFHENSIKPGDCERS